MKISHEQKRSIDVQLWKFSYFFRFYLGDVLACGDESSSWQIFTTFLTVRCVVKNLLTDTSTSSAFKMSSLFKAISHVDCLSVRGEDDEKKVRMNLRKSWASSSSFLQCGPTCVRQAQLGTFRRWNMGREFKRKFVFSHLVSSIFPLFLSVFSHEFRYHLFI